jgi:hypothetical protein
MASAANNQTIGSAAAEKIFDSDSDGGKCARFFVGCRSTSGNPVLVNIPGFHESGEWIGIPAGSSLEFIQMPFGIAEVFAQGSGGDAVVDYGVTERTRIE